MRDGTKRKAEPRTRGEADPEQYERFKEATRELDCEENRQRMDEVVRRAAKLPPPRQSERQPKPSRKSKS